MTGGDGGAIEYGYQEPVAALLTLGDVRGVPRYDYRSLGLGEEDVPELARLAVDRGLFWGDSESKEVWAPIHAWRALGDLRAEAAIDALVEVLSLPETNDDAEGYDDWIGEELPEVFASIGSASFTPLANYLREPVHQCWARTTAAEAIGLIVTQHPEMRDGAVALFTEVVEATTQHPGPTTSDDELVNAVLIGELLKLRAVESAPVIERAFAADRVDLTFAGDWEDVQIALGLRAERETPKRNYIREKFFGDAPPEVLDLLFGDVDLGENKPGGAWGEPSFVSSADDGTPPRGGLTPAQIKEREEEAKRKAKSKRKMAEQSRKQNRKKRK